MSTALSSFVHGGTQNLQRKKELWSIISKNKSFVDTFKTFPNEYDVEGNLRNAVSFTKFMNYRMDMDDVVDFILVHELSNGMYGLGVHSAMFLPAIKSLATPEQAQKWLGDARSLKIIGSFAQTEIGHGSSVKDIETTATYDEKSGDLIINTPSERAVKWWPGDLGHLANRVIVQAQLYIRGKCLGVHSFFVPIRDLETHQPLKGIEVGPLPKRMTGNFGNSGFLRFSNVRIPRENLLQKIAKIDEFGNYQRMGHDRKSYLPMMIARIVIATQGIECLKKALMIAIKYNLIRRQGSYGSGNQEVLLMDHQTQKMRLLPPLAMIFAMSALAHETRIAFSRVDDPVELHLITCCAKGHINEMASQMCELARRSVGGNGFLIESQIGPVATLVLIANTVEGDNVLLYIQIGRLLLASFTGRKQLDTAAFLHDDIAPPTPLTPVTSEKLLTLTQLLCKKMVMRLSDIMSAAVMKGESLSSVAQNRTQEVVDSAQIFCDFLLLKAFKNQKLSGGYQDKLLDHLQLVCSLYLVHLRANFYLEMQVITAEECSTIRQLLLSSLDQFSNQALSILESFSLPKELFSSVLIGNSEEEIYSNLLQAGRRTREQSFKMNPRHLTSKL